MLLLALQVLGLAGLTAGIIAFPRNRRDHRSGQEPRWPMRKAFLLGLLLAVGSAFVSYPVDDKLRIMGFPFVAAAFEKRGDTWIDFMGPLTPVAYLANAAFDFMGPLTPVAYLANAAFAFGLPHLLLRAWRRWRP